MQRRRWQSKNNYESCHSALLQLCAGRNKDIHRGCSKRRSPDLRGPGGEDMVCMHAIAKRARRKRLGGIRHRQVEGFDNLALHEAAGMSGGFHADTLTSVHGHLLLPTIAI